MFKLNRFLALIALMTLVGSSAFAATNKYKDTYTTEDSTGTWTFTNYHGIGQLADTHEIKTSTDTPSSVTAARTGDTWLFTNQDGPVVGGVGYTLTLPTAAAGLRYRFVVATTQTLSIRTTSTAVHIVGYGSRITSPASSGSTVTLVSNGTRWYVEEMRTPSASGAINGEDWVKGSA